MTATGHASDAIAISPSRLQTQVSFGWQLVWVISADLRRSDWAVLSLVRDPARGGTATVGMPMPCSNETHGRASDSGDPSQRVCHS